MTFQFICFSGITSNDPSRLGACPEMVRPELEIRTVKSQKLFGLAYYNMDNVIYGQPLAKNFLHITLNI